MRSKDKDEKNKGFFVAKLKNEVSVSQKIKARSQGLWKQMDSSINKAPEECIAVSTPPVVEPRVCPRFKVVKGAYSSVNVFDNPSEWNKSGIRKKYFTLSDDSDYFDSSGKTDTEWEKTRSNERYSTPSSRRTTQAQSTAQSNRYRLGSMASWDESVAPSTTGPRERFNTAETWEATTIAYVDDIASPPTSQEHSTSNLPPSYSLNSALKKMSRKSSFDAASFPSNNQKAESLVPTLKSRYFGKEAKVKFHDTYKDMSEKLNVASDQTGLHELIMKKKVYSCEQDIIDDKQHSDDEEEMKVKQMQSLANSLQRDQARASFNTFTRGSVEDCLGSSELDHDGHDDSGSPSRKPSKLGNHSRDMRSSSIASNHSMNNRTSMRKNGPKGSVSDLAGVHELSELVDKSFPGSHSTRPGTAPVPHVALDALRRKSLLVPPLKLDDELSPRSMFIEGCVIRGIPPRSCIILRQQETTKLDLSYQGIGDELGALLALSLRDLPALSSVQLRDNNLSDASLPNLIEAIQLNGQVNDLDISSNDLDMKAASKLAAFLSMDAGCPLKRLILSSCKIDDKKCENYLKALQHNATLEILDLSNNLIGQKDNNLFSKEKVLSGGELLGLFLRRDTIVLKSLNLQWNTIRGHSAFKLCEALKYCRSLIDLDLSYNSIGNDGAVEIGSALFEDQCHIKTINIASNSIGPESAFILCAAIRQSKCVQFICMDDNPIGELGGRMLMSLPLTKGRNITVSAQCCNITHQPSPKLPFSITDPVENYDLSMANSYGRAVLLELLFAVSRNDHYQISAIEIIPEGAPEPKARRSKKSKAAGPPTAPPCSIVLLQEEVELSDEEVIVLDRLEHQILIGSNMDNVKKFFMESDTDGSGELGKDEFREMLFALGNVISHKEANYIFKSIDVDNSGLVEFDECLIYLRQVAKDAVLRIRDIKYVAKCALSTSPTVPFVPPKSGKVRLTVQNTFDFSASSGAATEIQILRGLEAAMQAVSPATMMMYMVDIQMFRFTEACYLLEKVFMQMGENYDILARLLPRIVSTKDANKVLNIFLGASVDKRKILAAKLGTAFNPLVGQFDGYYALSLHQETDRLCFSRLIAKSRENENHRKSNDMGDISQLGNWSSFRNIYSAQQAIRELNVSTISALPHLGKIEFDFVNGLDRPDPNVDTVCSDLKIIRFMSLVGLLGEDILHTAVWGKNELDKMKKACDRSDLRVGHQHWKASVGRAQAIGNYLLANFGKHLEGRNAQVLKVQPLGKPTARPPVVKKEPGKSVRSQMFAMLEEEKMKENKVAEILQDQVYDADMIEFARDIEGTEVAETIGDVVYDALCGQGVMPSFTKKRAEKIKKKEVVIESVEAVCARFFSYRFLRCRHLALIIQRFYLGMKKESDFGTYRVELIITLFSKIVDLQYFFLVLMQLNPMEHACLWARLGVLSFLNPWIIDGAYELDLSRYEDREITKMLIQLALIEPGHNWEHPTFRRDRQSVRTPRWILNANWYSAPPPNAGFNDTKGLPFMGILTVKYYSGDGVNLAKCSVTTELRNCMLSLVLVDYNWIERDEEDRLFAAKEDLLFKSSITGSLDKQDASAVSSNKEEQLGSVPGVRSSASGSLFGSSKHTPRSNVPEDEDGGMFPSGISRSSSASSLHFDEWKSSAELKFNSFLNPNRIINLPNKGLTQIHEMMPKSISWKYGFAEGEK